MLCSAKPTAGHIMGAASKGDPETLFDAELLSRLGTTGQTGNTPARHIHPPPSLTLRPLCRSDYRRGFVQLLGQLTSVGDVSEEQFLRRFAAMKACAGTYYILVLEDLNTSEIVASATLVVEQKFIHNCAIRGRLEDVVVSDKCRGQQLGKLLTNRISILARELGCYKLTLECKDKLIPFYSSLGYTLEKGNSNYMIMRFDGDVS